MSVEYPSTPLILIVQISRWIISSASTSGTIHTTIQFLKDTCRMVISQFAFQSQMKTGLATQLRKFVSVWPSLLQSDIRITISQTIHKLRFVFNHLEDTFSSTN